MAEDNKKYGSLPGLKRFAQNLPWQRMRKAMGLGDTLGVLPPECGGTGAVSLDELKGLIKEQAVVKFKKNNVLDDFKAGSRTSYTIYFDSVEISDPHSWLSTNNDGTKDLVRFNESGAFFLSTEAIVNIKTKMSAESSRPITMVTFSNILEAFKGTAGYLCVDLGGGMGGWGIWENPTTITNTQFKNEVGVYRFPLGGNVLLSESVNPDFDLYPSFFIRMGSQISGSAVRPVDGDVSIEVVGTLTKL